MLQRVPRKKSDSRFLVGQAAWPVRFCRGQARLPVLRVSNRTQTLPDLRLTEHEQNSAQPQEQQPFDHADGPLETRLDGGIDLDVLQELDPASNGRMEPGIQPPRPAPADAVYQGDF